MQTSSPFSQNTLLSHPDRQNNPEAFSDHTILQASTDLYKVDINLYSVATGAQKPYKVFRTQDIIEHLPISLWCVDGKHYNALVNIEKVEARVELGDSLTDDEGEGGQGYTGIRKF